MSADVTAVRVTRRSAVALVLVSAAGLAMYLWPLLVAPPLEASHTTDAPFLFMAILPALLAILLAEMSSGGVDTKALAMLGVLSAVGAALRPLGAGTGGLEPMFFLLVLAGRAYGPGFGFVLGNTTMFASALLTGGMGPWLPFQMLGAGWIGLGAGLLPRARGRAELVVLSIYGAVSAIAYGFVLNMFFWPYTVGADTQLSFVAGDAVLSNLHRFVVFSVATSTWGWDVGRAITNVVAISLLGPAVLATLRRATRRAAFDAPVTFDPRPATEPDPAGDPAAG